MALGAASKLQYTLPAAEGSGELIVEKMTQKFAPDGEETGEDVDVRRFRVKEGRIETKCHYKKHAVTRPTILHEKGGADAAEDEDLQRILKAERLFGGDAQGPDRSAGVTQDEKKGRSYCCGG